MICLSVFNYTCDVELGRSRLAWGNIRESISNMAVNLYHFQKQIQKIHGKIEKRVSSFFAAENPVFGGDF